MRQTGLKTSIYTPSMKLKNLPPKIRPQCVKTQKLLYGISEPLYGNFLHQRIAEGGIVSHLKTLFKYSKPWSVLCPQVPSLYAYLLEEYVPWRDRRGKHCPSRRYYTVQSILPSMGPKIRLYQKSAIVNIIDQSQCRNQA